METKLTKKQLDSLHVYCGDLAEALNDAGWDQRKVLKPGIDIPWTKLSVKEMLWKEVQKAMLHKESTTDLTTSEVTVVYEALNKGIAEKFGVAVGFPSEQEMIARKIFNK